MLLLLWNVDDFDMCSDFEVFLKCLPTPQEKVFESWYEKPELSLHHFEAEEVVDHEEEEEDEFSLLL
ncbi:hypothetical protein CMV_002238 [Castanea mollissima]|uniref:Uncharacterized protein n=1 Tax=Castanea mollissima TaxID=60419 RepID=A0A8J4VWB2_9ROSI|nr:hypothetical protein CMV_002238 [Castanea mollissima]